MRAMFPPPPVTRAAIGGAAAMVALAALPALAVAAVPHPVALPDSVIETRVAADGSVHFVTQPSAGQYAVAAINPLGQLGPTTGVSLPKGVAASGLGPDGSAVFASWHNTTGHKGKMIAVTASPTGVSSAPVPLTGFDPTSLPESVTVGPTGAVAIVSTQTSVRGSIPTLVFRPAAAAPYGPTPAFGPGLSLGPALSQRKANVRTVNAQVVLGPDGGGAVLIEQVSRSHTPAPVVRRISPSGELGPELPVPIGTHFISTPFLAVAPSGTIAMLFDEDDAGKGRKELNRVVLTTLAPGASVVSAPQTLGSSTSSSLGGDNVSIAVGPGDQAAVLAGPGPGGIRAYTGPLTALASRGTIPGKRALAAQVVVGPDGSATAVWTRTGSGDAPDTLVEAHAPVGAPFNPSVDVTAERHADAGLLVDDQPVVLPNGNVALAYSRAAGFYDDNFISFTP